MSQVCHYQNEAKGRLVFGLFGGLMMMAGGLITLNDAPVPGGVTFIAGVALVALSKLGAKG